MHWQPTVLKRSLRELDIIARWLACSAAANAALVASWCWFCWCCCAAVTGSECACPSGGVCGGGVGVGVGPNEWPPWLPAVRKSNRMTGAARLCGLELPGNMVRGKHRLSRMPGGVVTRVRLTCVRVRIWEAWRQSVQGTQLGVARCVASAQRCKAECAAGVRILCLTRYARAQLTLSSRSALDHTPIKESGEGNSGNLETYTSARAPAAWSWSCRPAGPAVPHPAAPPHAAKSAAAVL